MFVKCPEATSGKPNNKFSCRDLWLCFSESLRMWFGVESQPEHNELEIVSPVAPVRSLTSDGTTAESTLCQSCARRLLGIPSAVILYVQSCCTCAGH